MLRTFIGIAWALLIAAAAPATAENWDIGLEDGVRYRSTDGRFGLSVGGRLHYDGADFRSDKTPLHDDWSARRLRLSVAVDLFSDWRLGAQYDFLDEERPFEFLWLSYRGFDSAQLIAGQITEPFGLEQMTNSNSLGFLERALPNALAPGTHVGLAARTRGARWQAAAGLFSQTRLQDDDPVDASEGLAVTGRFSIAPIARRGRVVHLGISSSLRAADEDRRTRFRARPESRLADVYLIDTGRIRQVDYTAITGLEAAWAWRSWLLQGEFIEARVHRNGRPTEVFDGGYLHAGFLLTGERRRYLRSGVFGSIKPKRAHGAWELVVRSSYLDLNGQRIFGGREDNLSWGLNWYAHHNLRLMFNYIQVNTDVHAGDDDPDILQMRLQVAI